MIRVFAHNRAQAKVLGKFQSVLLQVQNHLSTATEAVYIGNGVIVFATGLPTHAAGFTGTASEYLDTISNHKSAVKTHTKLPDKLGIGFLIAREVGQKICRARLRNRA